MSPTSTTIKKNRGRPVNEGLRQDIIKMATKLFMKNGLHATTMEYIASELKISKLTLYSRFKNKESLFGAVIHTKCKEFIPEHLFYGAETLTPEKLLYNLAISFMRLLTSEDAMGIERMLMGLDTVEAKRYTKTFYEAGPIRLKKQVANHLQNLSDAKRLLIPDPIMATNIFMSMIKGSDICFRIQMRIPPKPTLKDMEFYCMQVVGVFINAHSI